MGKIKKLTTKILNEVTQLYFEAENVLKKDGGWTGYNAFYNPDGNNVYLSKISIEYKVKKIPPKKIRLKKLRKEIKKRFDNKGWGVKDGIQQHYELQKRLSQKIVGQLLWWSKRDGNGIIKTINDKEYYFDKSVVSKSLLKKLDVNDMKFLKFHKNESINDCLAAHEVITFKSKSGRIEKIFNDKRQLESKMRKLSVETNKLDKEFDEMERASKGIKMKNVRMY